MGRAFGTTAGVALAAMATLGCKNDAQRAEERARQAEEDRKAIEGAARPVPANLEDVAAFVERDMPEDAELDDWAADVYGDFMYEVIEAIRSNASVDALWQLHDRYMLVLIRVGLRRHAMDPAAMEAFDSGFLALHGARWESNSQMMREISRLGPKKKSVVEGMIAVGNILHLVGAHTERAAERLGIEIPAPVVDCDALYSVAAAARLCGKPFDPELSKSEAGVGKWTCSMTFTDADGNDLRVRHNHAPSEEVAREGDFLKQTSLIGATPTDVSGLGDEAYEIHPTEDISNYILVVRKGTHVVTVFGDPEACPKEGMQALAREAVTRLDP